MDQQRRVEDECIDMFAEDRMLDDLLDLGTAIRQEQARNAASERFFAVSRTALRSFGMR